MINRISWAAALMAAAGLACSDAPKNTRPTTTGRLAPVAKKIGTYTMTITPMATGGGRQARVEVVPDLQDGNPNTNPAGSVQVAGRFAAVVDTGATNGCGVRSLNLPLTITNFAADPLANVQVQITGMSRTGFEVCAPATGNAGILPTPADTSPGATFGLVNYGTLAGSPVNNGTAPGTPQTVQWWFKYPSNTAVSFSFVVWADPRQPEQVSVPDLLAGSPLTWTSTGSGTGQLELCTTDPHLTGEVCPAPAVTAATGVANGLGGWDFSVIPATVDGTTYWWRARNTFAGVAGNFASGWDTFVATVPFNPPSPTITAPVGLPPAALTQFPADIIVPGPTLAPLNVTWTSAPTVQFTHIQVCDTIDCLPAFPGVGVLDESWEAGAPIGTPPNVAAYDYLFDASLSIPTDPLTGDTLLTTGVYYVNVYNWDDLAGLDVGAPAVSAFEIVPAGVGTVPPPSIVGPVGPEVDPLVGRQAFPANSPVLPAEILLQWTTDPSILDSQYEICDTPTCAPAAGFIGSLTAGPVPLLGVVPVVGAPTEFSVDAVPDLIAAVPDPASGGAWILPGTYYFFVTNLDPLGGPIGAPVASSFDVVTSMPTPAARASMTPADGTGFPQNALVSSTRLAVAPWSSAAPIVLGWTSPPEVLETWLELSYTPDFAQPIVVPAIAPTTFGATENGYVFDVATTLFTGADSAFAYLQTGTVYWRVYNADPATGNQLLPSGALANFAVTPVNPGWTVGSFTPTDTVLSANASFRGMAVELCANATCTAGGDPLAFDIGAATYSAALQPGASQFNVNLLQFAIDSGNTGQTVYWRVTDMDVYEFTFGNVPAALWTYGGAGRSVTVP